jgi:hypothetical protein
MDRLSTQTSTQALEIYKQVTENSDLDLSITFSGNVQVATKFDRAVNAIADHFRISSIEQRREQAKQVIRQKFDCEIKILAKHLPTAQRKFMDSALNLMIDGGNIEQAQQSDKMQPRVSAFNSALQHIRAMGSGDSKESNRIAWQATQEFVANGKRSPDVNFAQKVSELTLDWKKELKLGNREAYRLAFNSVLLCRKHGIQEKMAREILQVSGKLHAREGLEKNEALKLAIDLYIPVQKLAIGIDLIGNLRKNLISALPALKNYAPITQISAALAYCQLEQSGKNDLQSMFIVEKRIDNLKNIALHLPKGCKAECIHQGAHIRGKFTLSLDEIESCHNKLNSLKPDNAINQEKGLTEKFRLMSAQFGKDIRRMNYQFFRNGKTDPEVRSLIPNDLKLNIGTTDQEKDSWIESFIDYAGGGNAANLLSAFTSQTMFGDIRKVTASSNSKDLSVQFTGEQGTDNFIFVVDQTEVKKDRKTIVKATQFINPIKMTSTNLNENAPLGFQDAPAEFDLISAIGNDQRATPAGFGAKYECELEFDTEKLEKKIVDFTIKRIVAEFDLVLNQDNVDLYFEKVERL